MQRCKRFNKEDAPPYFMVTANESEESIYTNATITPNGKKFMFVHMCCQILYDIILYYKLRTTDTNRTLDLINIKTNNSAQQHAKKDFITKLIEQEEPDFMLLQESKEIPVELPANYVVVDPKTDDCNIIYSNKYNVINIPKKNDDKIYYIQFVNELTPEIKIDVCSIHCDSKGTDINTHLTTAIKLNTDQIPLIIGIDTNISVKNILSTDIKLNPVIPTLPEKPTFDNIKDYKLLDIIHGGTLSTLLIDDTFETPGNIYHPYHRTTNKARTFIQAQPKGVEAKNVSLFIDSGSTDDKDIDRTTKDYIFGYNVKKIRQYRGSLFNALELHQIIADSLATMQSAQKFGDIALEIDEDEDGDERIDKFGELGGFKLQDKRLLSDRPYYKHSIKEDLFFFYFKEYWTVGELNSTMSSVNKSFWRVKSSAQIPNDITISSTWEIYSENDDGTPDTWSNVPKQVNISPAVAVFWYMEACYKLSDNTAKLTFINNNLSWPSFTMLGKTKKDLLEICKGGLNLIPLRKTPQQQIDCPGNNTKKLCNKTRCDILKKYYTPRFVKLNTPYVINKSSPRIYKYEDLQKMSTELGTNEDAFTKNPETLIYCHIYEDSIPQEPITDLFSNVNIQLESWLGTKSYKNPQTPTENTYTQYDANISLNSFDDYNQIMITPDTPNKGTVKVEVTIPEHIKFIEYKNNPNHNFLCQAMDIHTNSTKWHWGRYGQNCTGTNSWDANPCTRKFTKCRLCGDDLYTADPPQKSQVNEHTLHMKSFLNRPWNMIKEIKGTKKTNETMMKGNYAAHFKLIEQQKYPPKYTSTIHEHIKTQLREIFLKHFNTVVFDNNRDTIDATRHKEFDWLQAAVSNLADDKIKDKIHILKLFKYGPIQAATIGGYKEQIFPQIGGQSNNSSLLEYLL